MSIRKLTRIALLSAILYVAKIALEFLPNVELVSLLIVLFTLAFGAETLFVITVFNLFELVQWGFGLWWVTYLYAWPLLSVLVLLLKRWVKEEFLIWSIVSGLFGLLFGGLFAIAYIPADRVYALTYWITGLPWDVWHGIWNFVLMLIVGKPLFHMLKLIKKKQDLQNY